MPKNFCSAHEVPDFGRQVAVFPFSFQSSTIAQSSRVGPSRNAFSSARQGGRLHGKKPLPVGIARKISPSNQTAAGIDGRALGLGDRRHDAACPVEDRLGYAVASEIAQTHGYPASRLDRVEINAGTAHSFQSAGTRARSHNPPEGASATGQPPEASSSWRLLACTAGPNPCAANCDSTRRKPTRNRCERHPSPCARRKTMAQTRSPLREPAPPFREVGGETIMPAPAEHRGAVNPVGFGRYACFAHPH
jgi:hypothetical protein